MRERSRAEADRPAAGQKGGFPSRIADLGSEACVITPRRRLAFCQSPPYRRAPCLGLVPCRSGVCPARPVRQPRGRTGETQELLTTSLLPAGHLCLANSLTQAPRESYSRRVGSSRTPDTQSSGRDLPGGILLISVLLEDLAQAGRSKRPAFFPPAPLIVQLARACLHPVQAPGALDQVEDLGPVSRGFGDPFGPLERRR